MYKIASHYKSRNKKVMQREVIQYHTVEQNVGTSSM